MYKSLGVSLLLLSSCLSFVGAVPAAKPKSTSTTTTSTTSTSTKHSSTSSATPSASGVLSCHAGTKEYDTNEVVTFDDVAALPALTGTQLPKGNYHGLLFQAFFASNRSDLLAGVLPHSLPNYATTTLEGETFDGLAEITSNFVQSPTSSFDVNSMYLGCVISDETGLVTPAQACIISMTGYKGTDISNPNFACAYTVMYDPSSAIGPVQMVYSGAFPAACSSITTLIFEYNIYPATEMAAGEVLGLAMDDVSLTLHGCNSTTS